MALQPLIGYGILIIEALRLHTSHTRWDSSRRVIS